MNRLLSCRRREIQIDFVFAPPFGLEVRKLEISKISPGTGRRDDTTTRNGDFTQLTVFKRYRLSDANRTWVQDVENKGKTEKKRPRKGGEKSGRRMGSQKCLEAKARPECVFKYFSNSAAFSRDLKAIAVSIRHGRYLDVWGTWPALCAFKRTSRSSVSPV